VLASARGRRRNCEQQISVDFFKIRRRCICACVPTLSDRFADVCKACVESEPFVFDVLVGGGVGARPTRSSDANSDVIEQAEKNTYDSLRVRLG
jgi:hypothetical protein